MTNHIHTSSMSTPAPGALAEALPSNAELAHDLREENRRLKQDCANLLAVCQQAQRFLRDLGPIRHDGTHNSMLALARELTKAINDCEAIS